MCKRAGRAKGPGAARQSRRRGGWGLAGAGPPPGSPHSKGSPLARLPQLCNEAWLVGGGSSEAGGWAPGWSVTLRGWKDSEEQWWEQQESIRRCRKGVRVTSGESVWMTGEGTGHLACWFHQSPCPVSLGRGCRCALHGEIDQGSSRPLLVELGFSLLCLAPNHFPVSEGLDPGYRGRRGGGEEPWAGRDPRRPTGHAVLGLEWSLAGSKKQEPSCSPSPLPASHHHPRKGVQAVF